VQVPSDTHQAEGEEHDVRQEGGDDHDAHLQSESFQECMLDAAKQTDVDILHRRTGAHRIVNSQQ
jgi:hypothetical protein